MKYIIIWPVRLYQMTLSSLVPTTCRFYPTCSEYMIKSVKKKGILRGVPKGLWRILRCNPLCHGGYDPVD